MAASITVDDRAFLAGLTAAARQLENDDGADFLHELGQRGASIARARAPHGATGGIVAGIGVRAGRDVGGPFVDLGVLNPPERREDFFQEFGTAKDRAQPFMRPALAALAGGVAAGGGSSKRSSDVRSRGVALRASKRSTIRGFRRRGGITAAEARATSRSVSSHFQIRRNKTGTRTWISNTKIRGGRS